MLNKVRVQNYKCLRNVEIDLEPLTVLIGPNDSGKSSFLSCLRTIGELSNLPANYGSAVSSEVPRNAWRRDARIQVTIEVASASPVDFSLSLRIAPDRQEQILTIEGHRFDYNAVGSFVHQAINTGNTFGRDRLLAIQQLLNVSAPYRFSPEEMRKAAVVETKPTLSPRGDNLAAVINALLTGPDRTAVTELEQSLAQAIPTLRGISTPASSSTERVLEFALAGPERPPLTIPADQVSDGAMYLVAFLALVHTQSAQVLLIEEPENGLHPARLQTVMDLLRKIASGQFGYPARQIILTTHSPVLLNCVTPKEVRIFRRDEEGATNVTRMDQLPGIEKLRKEFAPGEMWLLFGEEELISNSAR